jgi:hypothetical protein
MNASFRKSNARTLLSDSSGESFTRLDRPVCGGLVGRGFFAMVVALPGTIFGYFITNRAAKEESWEPSFGGILPPLLTPAA